MPDEPEEDELTKLVCFELQGQEYAVDIAHIKESLAQRPLTRVALTPSWVAGIINLRGDVVAVLDLSLFLGMGESQRGPASRTIIARHDSRRAGFLCDRLLDLRECRLSELQMPPPTLAEDSSGVLAGTLTLDRGRVLRVLDVPALFESRQLAAFRRGESS